MTRRGKLQPGDGLDLAGAFRFLGMGSARRDLDFVIELLRESGVEEVSYDDDLVALAEANGARAFDALTEIESSVQHVGRVLLGARFPVNTASVSLAGDPSSWQSEAVHRDAFGSCARAATPNSPDFTS